MQRERISPMWIMQKASNKVLDQKESIHFAVAKDVRR